MRQYFYLVVINYDESTYPQKIFLQEHQAIEWGRREATKSALKGDTMYEYVLFKQEIARTATLTRVKTLLPYKSTKGADLDVDKGEINRTPSQVYDPVWQDQ